MASAGSASTSFGAWFDSQKAAGAIAPPASPSVGSSYWGGGSNTRSGDEEKGTAPEDTSTENSSFLPGFLRRSSAPAPSEWTCGLTMGQRVQIATLLLVAAGFLFMMAVFVFLPMVVLFPSKFASAFTFASLLVMIAFALFRGPRTTILGLLERERLPFTASYISSLLITLYATYVSQNYIIIVFALLVQVGALLWYASTFIPGGTAGMSFISRMALASATSSARGVAGMVVGR